MENSCNIKQYDVFDLQSFCLSPQLIKSLKKAFEPVLTDVRIDWYLPENMEALLSPNEIPPLYPGNRLIGYCTLYDMTGFKTEKTEVCIVKVSSYAHIKTALMSCSSFVVTQTGL